MWKDSWLKWRTLLFCERTADWCDRLYCSVKGPLTEVTYLIFLWKDCWLKCHISHIILWKDRWLKWQTLSACERTTDCLKQDKSKLLAWSDRPHIVCVAGCQLLLGAVGSDPGKKLHHWFWLCWVSNGLFNSTVMLDCLSKTLCMCVCVCVCTLCVCVCVGAVIIKQIYILYDYFKVCMSVFWDDWVP